MHEGSPTLTDLITYYLRKKQNTKFYFIDQIEADDDTSDTDLDVPNVVTIKKKHKEKKQERNDVAEKISTDREENNHRKYAKSQENKDLKENKKHQDDVKLQPYIRKEKRILDLESDVIIKKKKKKHRDHTIDNESVDIAEQNFDLNNDHLVVIHQDGSLIDESYEQKRKRKKSKNKNLDGNLSKGHSIGHKSLCE